MKIGLLGTFDVNNFGDCLFPELYQYLLRQQMPDVEVELFSPTDKPAEILSFKRISALPSTFEETEKLDADALVLVGGETIGFGHSSGTYNFPRETLSHYLRLWLSPTLAANDPKLRPRFFGAHCVGALKMPQDVNALIAQALGQATFCSFRDSFSVSWIQSGETSFAREVDPMFLIDCLMSHDSWSELASTSLPDDMSSGGYIVAQWTLGYGKNDMSAWTKAIAEISDQTGLPVVLLPICHFLGDEPFLNIAAERLGELGTRCHLVRGLRNVKLTAAIIGNSAGYCGSSLHGAVTAISFGKPLAVLGHSMDGKHEGSMRAVGIHGVVTTDCAGLPECFEHATGLDMANARTVAQTAARDSFGRFLDRLEISTPKSANSFASLEPVARQLMNRERALVRVFSKAEVKRGLLRWLSRRKKLRAVWDARRMKQKIAAATSVQRS